MSHSVHPNARVAGFVAAAGIAIAATCLFGGAANAATPHRQAAVFVQTDNTSGNAIVAYDRSSDGQLSAAGTYPTGGLGGVLAGSVVDHTASQGSLTYDRSAGLLYAVNAGSNTVTVLRVDGDRLTRLQVISSSGDFPVSVTAHGNFVYVLNARDGGSIQGYLRIGATLICIPSWHRDLGLNPAQTPEFTSTPGQVAFTPDGSSLVVTTKGNGNSIDVFAQGGLRGPAATPVTTVLTGDVPFAVAFDPAGHLAVTLTGPNALATFGSTRTVR